MVTPAAERKAVAHLVKHHEMSERRACKAIGCCRMTIRYESTRPDDGALRERMKAIAHERRRFGYRRLHVMLGREGFVVNHKRLFRLYCEEKLKVRRRGGRKRAMGTRRPIEVPLAPNQRWSLDFVSDQLTDGRRFRILTVIDNCTRECLALVADTSLSGRRVARELDDINASHVGETFAPNRRYKLKNERDYSKPENQQRVIEQSSEEKFEPRYHINNDPDMANGPPLLFDEDEGPDAVGANSRVMHAQRVYARNGRKAQAYRDQFRRMPRTTESIRRQCVA